MVVKGNARGVDQGRNAFEKKMEEVAKDKDKLVDFGKWYLKEIYPVLLKNFNKAQIKMIFRALDTKRVKETFAMFSKDKDDNIKYKGVGINKSDLIFYILPIWIVLSKKVLKESEYKILEQVIEVLLHPQEYMD